MRQTRRLPTLGRVVSLRARLFLVSLILVGAFATSSGAWFITRMRTVLTDDVEENLASHARILQVVLHSDEEAELVALADAVSRSTSTRVTLIAADGRVLADSDVPDESGMDNHATRPEVLSALGSEGYGVSRRYSDTVHRDMLYVALPWNTPHGTGVVRVSRPLTVVESEVARLRGPLLVAALGGLFLAVLLAGLFSELVTRDLRALTLRARTIARPGTDPGGDEIAWITGSIDRLTRELQRALDEVADERNRLQAVLSGMREAVIALDRQGRVDTINAAARDLFGLHRDVSGTDFGSLVGSDLLNDLVRAALEAGEAGSTDVVLTEATTPVSLLATATPQVGGGAVVVLHDVTELRQLESVRRDFVANVSHELRTPVAVIQSSAEALVDGAVSDPVHGPRFADAIGRHAARLGNLIADLLDLAKIEAGGRLFELEPLSVQAVAREVVAGLRQRAERRDQTIVVDVPADLRVMADPVAFEQVLVNLLENALKYTPEWSTVEILGQRTDRGVQIDIADDGPGIPREHHDRLFERFYRVDPGRSRDAGGTGLGLSIVKHLVEAHGGSIRVMANQPKGTRFRIVLPAA